MDRTVAGCALLAGAAAAATLLAVASQDMHLAVPTTARPGATTLRVPFPGKPTPVSSPLHVRSAASAVQFVATPAPESRPPAPKLLLSVAFLVGFSVAAVLGRLLGRRPERSPLVAPLGGAAPSLTVAMATVTSERNTEASKVKQLAPMRTRFAPSPTGSLHVGGARTALYNWLMAKKTGGTFILRIEDTDLARSTRASEESMKADLRWLGLLWDEGPDTPKQEEVSYRQSERGSFYVDMAKKLIDKMGPDGKTIAYPCFSSQEEVDALKQATETTGEFQGTFVSPWRDAPEDVVKAKLAAGEPYAVRFRVPKGKRVAIDDVVRGPVSWDAEATIGDFVLLRSTGVPVYNFCVAVDDALMGITHVIRAEEHLTNTLRQGLILEALGFKMPTYAHCSLILGEDGSKLSKRHGATSVAQFAAEGFVPSAMINYLVGLGWNDGTDKEVYTVDEIINVFSIERIQKSPSVFDMKKLKWINAQHLKNMDDSALAALLGPFLLNAGLCASKDSPLTGVAAHMCKQKIELLADAVPIVKAALGYELDNTLGTDAAAAQLLSEDFKELAKALVAAYDRGEFPDPTQADFMDKYGSWVKDFGKTIGRKGKQLMQPVRLALTGVMSGPDVGYQLRIATIAHQEGVPAMALEHRMQKLRALADA